MIATLLSISHWWQQCNVCSIEILFSIMDKYINAETVFLATLIPRCVACIRVLLVLINNWRVMFFISIRIQIPYLLKWKKYSCADFAIPVLLRWDFLNSKTPTTGFSDCCPLQCSCEKHYYFIYVLLIYKFLFTGSFFAFQQIKCIVIYCISVFFFYCWFPHCGTVWMWQHLIDYYTCLRTILFETNFLYRLNSILRSTPITKHHKRYEVIIYNNIYYL